MERSRSKLFEAHRHKPLRAARPSVGKRECSFATQAVAQRNSGLLGREAWAPPGKARQSFGGLAFCVVEPGHVDSQAPRSPDTPVYQPVAFSRRAS